MALPLAAFGIPLTIIILRPFFRSIPVELEDAAAIDGCSRFGFFWRILLPLSRPALATVAHPGARGQLERVPAAAAHPRRRRTSGRCRWASSTSPSQYSQDVAAVLAYTSLSMVPALLFYVFAERQLIGGLTSGSRQGMSAREDVMSGTSSIAARRRAIVGRRASAPPYRDAGARVDERARDLLGRMTLDEKLAQLGSVWTFDLVDGDRLDDGQGPRSSSPTGIGQVTRVAGATNLPPERVAELGNAIQRFLVEETRLGIPAIIHEESLHGVMARDATCFPQSIGQAASWDPALVEEVAATHRPAPARDRREPGPRARPRHRARPALGPNRGDIRGGPVPRGRPWLRLRARHPGERRTATRSVIATAKHMVGHGLPEGGLNQAPAHIGARELHDAFLFPFEAAVRGAGIGSVMHAYDDLDGVPCVASRELLTTILRERWGFDGIVVADYMGVEQLVIRHQLTDDLSVAAAMALDAGMDVELPDTAAFGEPLRAAVEDGRVDLSLIETSVERVLRTKLRLGLFEQPYADVSAATRVGARPGVTDEADLALAMARRSIVLLENDGTLPLRPDLARLAVIGPNADSARALVGDYGHLVHIETLLENRGREGVAGSGAPLDLQLADELASWPTVLQAIRARVPAGTDIRYAPGCGIRDGDDEALAAAVEAARGADAAILVLGERSGLTAESTSGETRDRMELGLLGRQGELVAAIAATGTPVIIVLISGRPVSMPIEAALASAVLHAWVPGEAGPQAIVDVLFGDVVPGRQAAGDGAEARRAGAALLRAPAHRRRLGVASGLRGRLAPAAVAVRARPVVHALRALGTRGRRLASGHGRRGGRQPGRFERRVA